ncbi:unnamed protein product [Arabidopsis thaliana]|uniref:(thale cress) hypothetical protein n=1 Tax=Arabidopsis thaliana TaxID=3702 RepID=A0A7G2F065_ARATH|nr:unnamed protein product [Arabidopsis thaliana]
MYNQQSGGKGDVVVATSGTSEEYNNLPCGVSVADSGLTALNPELSLGQGEASSVSSYTSLEGEALCVYSIITEQQDADIPILNRLISCHHDDGELSENQNPFNSPTSEPENVCNFFFI